MEMGFNLLKRLIFWILTLVLVGFVATIALSGENGLNMQNPADSGLDSLNEAGNGLDLPSPGNHILEDSIHVYKDKIVIDIENARWAKFLDSNSMDPIIDSGANSIELVPKSPEQLQVGDIVSYESKYAEGIFIHRIIEIGEDELGWYCRLKGDNLDNIDPGRIRFNQIHGVVVGILY